MHYSDLDPYYQYTQQTFVSHPWAVFVEGKCECVFVVPLESNNDCIENQKF